MAPISGPGAPGLPAAGPRGGARRLARGFLRRPASPRRFGGLGRLGGGGRAERNKIGEVAREVAEMWLSEVVGVKGSAKLFSLVGFG